MAAGLCVVTSAAQAQWKHQEFKTNPPQYMVMGESAPLKTLGFLCGPGQELIAILLAMNLDVVPDSDMHGTIDTGSGPEKMVWQSTRQTRGLVPVQQTGADAVKLMERVAAASSVSFTVRQKNDVVATWSFAGDARSHVAWLRQQCKLK
jgi:hypothetical protein